MIKNLPNKLKKYEKQVKDFVNGGINYYFGHNCFKTLKSKKGKLNDSIDMRFNSSNNTNNRVQNAWKSNIAIPMVREAFIARRAILAQAFSQPELVTVLPDGLTPHENAKNMQDVVMSVIKTTHFHENTLEPVIDSCSRYGCAVVVSNFEIKEKIVTKTVPREINGIPDGYDREKVIDETKGVYTDPIDILNYFQQPEVAISSKAAYRGYVERVPVYQIANEAKEDEQGIYIKENIDKVLKLAENGSIESTNYYQHKNLESAQIVTIDRFHYYGKLTFQGNRDDDTTYYIQMAGGEIIRFQENPNDEDLVPIDVYTIDKRPEYWWGSTDAENVVPMENYMQMILSMYADSAMQELQRYILYDTGTGINTTKINQAAKNGGFVGVDRKQGQSLKDIFHQYQFTGISTSNVNYIVSELKEGAQRVRPKGDFTMQPNQGGMKNKTAEAARIITQQGSTLESYFLRMFSYGLRANIRTMIVMLKQHLGDYIIARPKPTEDPVELMKMEILGDFNPTVATALTENQVNRSQRLLNFITAVMNFKGSGDPSWMRYDLGPVIREFTKDILQESVDVDLVYPEMSEQEIQMQRMQMQQQQAAQMMGPQAGPPQPQGALQNVA